MKKKAYIAAPFTEKTVGIKNVGYGTLKDKNYRKFLERIEEILRRCGYEVHLPHRDTMRWGTVNDPPEKSVKLALKEIASCDLLVACPGNSPGAFIEIGWAAFLKKKIIIIHAKNEPISSFLLGLHGVATTKILRVDSEQELEEKLENSIKEITKAK